MSFSIAKRSQWSMLPNIYAMNMIDNNRIKQSLGSLATASNQLVFSLCVASSLSNGTQETQLTNKMVCMRTRHKK